MRVTYHDVEQAGAILLVDLDAEQEVPILHLRIRKAAAHGAEVFVIHPRRTRLWDVAEHVACRPGQEASVLEEILEGSDRGSPLARARAALGKAGTSAVVLAGAGLAEHPLGPDLALRLAGKFGARFAMVPRRAGDRGALRAGVHPALLPGGRRLTVDAERAEVEAVWGALPNPSVGRNARQILEACAGRQLDVLVMVGVDPLRDFPDATLARRALDNVPYKVVQALELGSLGPFADAALPAAASMEKDGQLTDWEGRPQLIRPIRPPAGLSRPDWEIFATLALAMGGDLRFETLDGLRQEMAGLLQPREPAERSTAWVDTDRPQWLDDLTLFTYPLLVDEGNLSERAVELKAALGEEPFLEVHPDDADKRKVVDGGLARVRTDAGEAILPVRVTEHVAQGAVFVPFNQPGLAANTLLSGRFTAAATVEPADQGAGA
jgi:NADH-quinone oxidoreductase subunit G